MKHPAQITIPQPCRSLEKRGQRIVIRYKTHFSKLIKDTNSIKMKRILRVRRDQDVPRMHISLPHPIEYSAGIQEKPTSAI
uniref:Uncharacterized protein n=1 Tax=Rhizophora mucronata TaxID=61149 RepID=A0A2P2MYY2_RHIMU